MAWTDVTEAIAAAIGAVATPSAVLIGIRSLRWQQQQAMTENKRMAQQGVKGVIVDTSIRQWPTAQGDDTYQTVVATVVNRGPEPIFEMALRWRYSGSTYEESTNKVSLLPGESWDCPAPTSIVRMGPFEGVNVFVTFYDADSKGWAKTQRGDFATLRDAIFEGW